MLIVWISLWITPSSLCKTRGYPEHPKEAFYDKKTLPHFLSFQTRRFWRVFYFAEILRENSEIEAPDMV